MNITLDTYSHVLPGMGDAAASAMDDGLRLALRRVRSRSKRPRSTALEGKSPRSTNGGREKAAGDSE